MASVTQNVAVFPGGQVWVTYDSSTHVISAVGWDLRAGKTTISVTQAGKVTITVSKTLPESGTQAVSTGLGYNIDSLTGFSVSWAAR